MSKSALSVFIFGLYVIALGIVLIVVPNFLLSLLSLPNTTEVWIRAIGVTLLYLGIFDVLAARNEMTKFFLWSVYLRASAILFTIAFVLLDFVQPPLILIGVVDLMGAIWTGIALRSPKPSMKAT